MLGTRALGGLGSRAWRWEPCPTGHSGGLAAWRGRWEVESFWAGLSVNVRFGDAVLSRELQHSFCHQWPREGHGPGVLSQSKSCLGSGRPGSSSLLTSVEGSLPSPPGMACSPCQEVTSIFMGNESFYGAAFSQMVGASRGFSGESCVPFPSGQWFPGGVPDGLQEKQGAASSPWGDSLALGPGLGWRAIAAVTGAGSRLAHPALLHIAWWLGDPSRGARSRCSPSVQRAKALAAARVAAPQAPSLSPVPAGGGR